MRSEVSTEFHLWLLRSSVSRSFQLAKTYSSTRMVHSSKLHCPVALLM